jgi:N-acetylmuramoyl-L-alanine amidase
MKIAISAGHTPVDPGATTGINSEYGLTSEIVGRCVNLLSQRGYEVWLIGADSNAKQIEKINQLDADCGLELHFNSCSDPDVQGCETLYSGSQKGKSLAELIQKRLVSALKTADRGVKIGYYRQDRSQPVIPMLRLTNCPFVIPEPLFLSAAGDFSKLNTELVAKALCQGIEDFFKSKLK